MNAWLTSLSTKALCRIKVADIRGTVLDIERWNIVFSKMKQNRERNVHDFLSGTIASRL